MTLRATCRSSPLMREADHALHSAGLTGNEDRLFALVRELRPSFSGSS